MMKGFMTGKGWIIRDFKCHTQKLKLYFPCTGKIVGFVMIVNTFRCGGRLSAFLTLQY